MIEKNRLRVAVLAGGVSGERQVSLDGAAQVAANMDPDSYQVTMYDTAIDLPKLVEDAAEIDVALIILHGLYGEDGTVQGFLDLLGIPYQGAGVLGSALAMDKNLSKKMYCQAGLPVAKWETISLSNMKTSFPDLRLPLVIKPVKVGSSLGLTIARTTDQVKNGVEKALGFDSEVMVEEYIEGREITVGVLGNDRLQALPVIEIIPGDGYEFFDYEAKYQVGATSEICPAKIDNKSTQKAQELAVVAHDVLKLRGYSRTDMILTPSGEIFLLETNTIPGMTQTSLFPRAAKVHGLDYGQLLDKLIELALE